MSGRPVVVTGLGLVAWPGAGLDATWAALATGARPPGPVASPPLPWLRHAVPEALESQAKFLNGASQLAADAVASALEASGVAAAGLADDRKALFSAQVDWTVTDYAAYRAAMADATDGFGRAPDLEALNGASVRKMNPFYLLETLNNNAFSLVSAWHGHRGANTSVSGWRGPGVVAVTLAARAVAAGHADAAVGFGTGRLAGPVTVVELARTGLLPEGARPGDGAGAVVLEPADAAARRGARALAAVRGVGAGSAGRGTAAAAARAAAEAACAEAGVALADVGTVVADGAATLAALGAGPRGLAPRLHLGEAGPGSDVIDVALAAAALARGTRPDGTPAGATALVVTSGLEGQAAAVLLARAG